MSTTETQPAVVAVDCSLPVSRLLALNNIVWNNVGASSAASSSLLQQSQSVQQKAVSGGQSNTESGVKRKDFHSRDNTAKKPRPAASTSPRQDKNLDKKKEVKKKESTKKEDKKTVRKKKANPNDSTQDGINKTNDNKTMNTVDPYAEADFSNLNLLATFASTLLPLSLIST